MKVNLSTFIFRLFPPLVLIGVVVCTWWAASPELRDPSTSVVSLLRSGDVSVAPLPSHVSPASTTWIVSPVVKAISAQPAADDTRLATVPEIGAPTSTVAGGCLSYFKHWVTSTSTNSRQPLPRPFLSYSGDAESSTSITTNASDMLHTNSDGWTGPANIVMVKPEKVAGTTMGGVIRRIARRHGYSRYDENWKYFLGKSRSSAFLDACTRRKVDMDQNKVCETVGNVFADHSPFRDIEKGVQETHRLLGKTLLLTVIRDPYDRCRSLQRSGGTAVMLCKGGFFRYMMAKTDQTAEDIIRRYDFFIVKERFEESVVLLAHLLNVSFADILFLDYHRPYTLSSVPSSRRRVSSKVATSSRGTARAPSKPRSSGTRSRTSVRTAERRGLGAVPEEFIRDNVDYEIYEHATRILTQGIKDNGLEPAVEAFVSFQSQAKSACHKRSNECTYTGDPKPKHVVSQCWMAFRGCGQRCLDEFAARNSLHEIRVGC